MTGELTVGPGEIDGLPPKPDDIPAKPNDVYEGHGWSEEVGWGTFLGTGRIADQQKEWRPYDKAVEFVHKLGLGSKKDWHNYCKGLMPDKEPLPKDIPKSPHLVKAYTKFWRSWADWLVNGRRLGRMRLFLPARSFARKLKLRSQDEWLKYCRGELPDLPPKPSNIPTNPSVTYKNQGWKGWPDWLGK